MTTPSIESYWRGSDSKSRLETYKAQVTDTIIGNGKETHRRILLLTSEFERITGISLPGVYSSGWRPSAVNDATANAASGSKHLTAEAGDVKDTPAGDLAWWCFKFPKLSLEPFNLYMEHPIATVVKAKVTPWCHLQIVAPRSGSRVFFPNDQSVRDWAEYQRSKA